MQNFFIDFQHYFPPGVTVTSHKPCTVSFLVYDHTDTLAKQILAIT